MELYIFRHGIAEDRAEGKQDAARALTEEGKKKTAAVAKLAAGGGVSPSLIVSSPLVRAVETARIAARELGYKGEVLSFKSLAPLGPPQAVWADIRDHKDEAAILLAGHEPLLGHLVGYLLNCPSLPIDMKKSAMVRIDVESFGAAPRGTLRWMVVPKLAG